MARHPNVQYIRFYTDGSAARKVEPVAPLKTIKLPKIKKSKRITVHIDPIAVAGIVMAAVMLVLMMAGVTQLRGAREQMQVMASYVDTLTQENEQLQQTLSQGYNLDEIQRTALALGLVPKEQVRHVSIQVPQPQVEEEPGAWEQLYTFLVGLFA